MSSAVMERVLEEPRTQGPVLVAPVKVAEKTWEDPHPLVPVFIAGVIALALSALFVGSILAWLALRHTGIMAL